MRARILELLRQNTGEYLSGEEISRQFAVSRTAIWKHMRELKHTGYDIVAHSRRGYCLQQTPDRLLPDEIRARLTTSILGREIHFFDEVGSTNTEAKRLATAGCSDGTIVVAEAQNGGRGRLSRGWFSPSCKGIWLSIVLRPPFHPQDAPKCTLLTAVVIVKAIQKVTGVQCGIKWPNDILYNRRKLVGILTEMSAEMDAVNYIVVGAGINVNVGAAEFPEEIADIATSLSMIAGRTVGRLELLAEIVNEMERSYLVVIREGFAGVISEWRSFSATLGQAVDVIGINSSFSGTAIDIDDEGALLVRTEKGLERVVAGDVSIRPAGSHIANGF